MISPRFVPGGVDAVILIRRSGEGSSEQERGVAGREALDDPPFARGTTTMAVTGIAFVMYPVADMPRAVAFYRDVLGLTPAGIVTDFWVEFEIAGGTFALGKFDDIGKPGSAQSLALETPDLPAFRTLLAQRGVASTEPYDTPVCWMSVVRDPDGNQVCLHQSKSR
jgi:catechol 2,3-dioxygenase-like lactoylglutathione lyase family enzyme